MTCKWLTDGLLYGLQTSSRYFQKYLNTFSKLGTEVFRNADLKK